MNINIPTNEELATEIRSDVWHLLTLQQLIIQSDLIMKRLDLILSANMQSTPTGRNIYLTLLHASEEISNIIANTSAKRNRPIVEPTQNDQ